MSVTDTRGGIPRDEHGNDAWIWRELLGEDVLTAAGHDVSDQPRAPDGRFGEVSGEHADTGAWRELSRDERLTRNVDREQHIHPELTREQAQERAQRHFERMERARLGNRVFVLDDKTSVSIDNKVRISEAKTQELLNTTSDLRGLYPNKPIEVSVITASNMAIASPNAMGATMRGANMMLVAQPAVSPSGERNFRAAVQAGGFMPSGMDTSATRYTLFHEMGHMMDTPKTRDRSARSDQILDRPFGAGSMYGRSSHTEAFAEAFAEWHLSEGRTKDAAAVDLAESEGWHKFGDK